MRLATPDGPKNPRIAIVAARPGKHEVGLCNCPWGHPTGIGLVGPSGKLLWSLLAQMGVRRSQCYVTNVRKDYSEEHSVPTKSEISEALPALQEELKSVNTNIVIALGAEALFALTGKTSLEAWRGSTLWSDFAERKVIASWHPAAVFRRYAYLYVLEADLRKAVKEADFPTISQRERRFALNPSLDEFEELLKGMGSPVSVDIETFGKNISCIGLSDKPEEAVCLPLVGPCKMTTSERAVAVRLLSKFFRGRPLVGQNIGMFDYPKLEAFGFRLGPIEMDTMLAHHLLWPELGMKSRSRDDGTEKFAGSHDLAFLCSAYTDVPYYKDLADKWRLNMDWEMFWRYNCLDACVTYEVYLRLKEELEEFSQTSYYRGMVDGLIGPVRRMQDRGLLIDVSKLETVRNRIRLETAYLQAKLNHAVGFACNVRSTVDLKFLLHDKLSLPKLKRTPKGEPSTDEETLRTLAYGSEQAPIFKLILDIRERRTLESGFLQMEVPKDGRYRARYKIHGTDSGRLSSTSGRIAGEGRGPQLQNVPKSARHLFVAERGHVFVVSDLRRAESMYVAFDAGDDRLISLFKDPSRDLYKEVAAAALGKAVEEIESWEREVFKQVVHGSNYMMGPGMFIKVLRLRGINIEDLKVRGIQVPLRKAEYLLGGYHQAAPKVKLWQSEIASIVRKTRVLHDGLGRRRFFMGSLRDQATFRVACSYRPQASVVGVTNRALIQLDAEGWKIILQVHDSIGIECPEDRVAECRSAMEKALMQPVETFHGKVSIPVDTKVGRSWGELHEV